MVFVPNIVHFLEFLRVTWMLVLQNYITRNCVLRILIVMLLINHKYSWLTTSSNNSTKLQHLIYCSQKYASYGTRTRVLRMGISNDTPTPTMLVLKQRPLAYVLSLFIVLRKYIVSNCLLRVSIYTFLGKHEYNWLTTNLIELQHVVYCSDKICIIRHSNLCLENGNLKWYPREW